MKTDLVDDYERQLIEQSDHIAVKPDFKSLPLRTVSISSWNKDNTVEYRFGDITNVHEPTRVVKLKEVDNATCNRIASLCNNRFQSSVFFFTGGPVWQAHITNPITVGKGNWFDWSANVQADFVRPILSPSDVANLLLEIMDKLKAERG